MIISKDFPGGNIEVISISENEVVVERELRDTEGDWFYWAFCVDNACPQGKESQTVRFSFPNKDRVGKFGAAVSHDRIHWSWTDTKDGDSFSYTFRPMEKAYFAFCAVYSDEMLRLFAKENDITVETFCTSRKGRSVPCYKIGDGEKIVVFTSRHHACESTGTYLMEGIARACLENPVKGYTFLFIPFVDYDGVMDGDQGKNRKPYDHNRDYGNGDPIYPETAALRKLADSGKVWASFDLHSPWMDGDEHDSFYCMRIPFVQGFDEFYQILADETSKDDKSFTYDGTWDFEYDVKWNEATTPNMRNYFLPRVSSGVAITAETSYFGTRENPFSAERILKLGHHFYKALLATIIK